ncbi:hypothetical protein K437DRAFT_18002 [Tilletiaria anomala UBC 951]|uniref:Uncharacterized protein n=1 Tax=Tilletiaria anomala (strain ATCC 24038 / CBS 436.72 / UBC 951) TaxID=1037660 RepID=A0A066WEN1_TILAU|nr:uncharacterized protein K437DRAFT_18002 [Tilletiaria anomala UBC 951]KDN52377.1 hypothetical protein K437DRAFT_18002 [Tilletiaria anomala UBC 951]
MERIKLSGGRFNSTLGLIFTFCFFVQPSPTSNLVSPSRRRGTTQPHPDNLPCVSTVSCAPPFKGVSIISLCHRLYDRIELASMAAQEKSMFAMCLGSHDIVNVERLRDVVETLSLRGRVAEACTE